MNDDSTSSENSDSSSNNKVSSDSNIEDGASNKKVTFSDIDVIGPSIGDETKENEELKGDQVSDFLRLMSIQSYVDMSEEEYGGFLNRGSSEMSSNNKLVNRSISEVSSNDNYFDMQHGHGLEHKSS